MQTSKQDCINNEPDRPSLPEPAFPPPGATVQGDLPPKTEPFVSAGCRFRANCMSAVAEALRAAQRLRRGPLAALLGLPLLFALAAPAAAQTVSFSSPDYPVWEGDAAKLDVVLSASRAAATTVKFQAFGTSATGQGVDYIGEHYTVTIPAGHPRATLTIRTVQDALKENTERINVAIVEAGVDIGFQWAADVHIQDDDQDAGRIPRLKIHRQGTLVPGLGMSYAVAEGNPASFSVSVGTDWASPEELTVSLKVSEDTSEGQDFVASGNEGARTMTIHPWRDGAAKIYQVATATDSVRETDGAVTVTLVPTNDYAVDPGHYQATVEVADDDEPRDLILTSSTPMFGGLTMPEGGGGGYTVRLASPPTGTVTVSVTARDDGDGDGDWGNVKVKSQSQSQKQSLSESQILSLTFTQDDWHIPQGIGVFSQGDAGYVNDRFSLVHTASGGGYGGVSGAMRVGVVDNPPPPALFQSVADNWALKPSGIGVGGQFRLLFLTAARDATPSDIATYNSFVQTEAAGGHTAIQSYSSHFRVVGSTASVSARDNTETTGAGDGIPIYWLNGDKIADDYDDFWDGSWDAQMSSDTRGANGMAVSGALRVWTGARTDGGIHSNPLGSSNVRYGEWGASTNPISNGTDVGSGARRMLALSPVFEVLSGLGMQAAPPPSQAVSNVQVTAVDAANARVTWDAVEHATFYRVEYESTSALVNSANYVYGAVNRLTGTRYTFQHDAAEAMTLTVTVTPGYVDDQDAWRLLDDLAATATIDVGPAGGGDSIRGGGSTDNVDAGTGNTPQPPDFSALKATVRGYADETQHGDAHVNRWKRALAGLGDGDAIAEGYKPMTAAEAQDMADTYTASRWDPVVEALTELESRETEPDPIPELSLSAGSAVDEGASASFTIHAAPAPASDVTVSVTVSQSGDYLDAPGAGSRTVTLPAGAATARLSVATADDGADEPDGSISVSIDSGTGYTVASSNHTASVTVRDDDDPPPVKTIGACVSVSQWDTVKGYYDSNAYRSPNYGANWYRVLIAYHEDRSDQTLPDWVGATSKPSSAYTVKEAERSETVWSGWTAVRKVLQCLEKESGQSFAPLLPSSSNSAHEGVVRFVNASPQGGSVHIRATDDSGWSPPPVTLHVGPGESVHLTTGDLEQGNAAKGLSGYLGAATGDWRLDVSSERDIRMLPYVRAYDGVLAPMHAVAEAERGVHRVSTFAPANDPGAPGRTGLLRLINRGGEALTAHIAGTDDSGAASGEVSLAIPASESVLLTAAELEGGASGLRGALGDGRGMWQLNIASDGDLAVMSLLRSGGGHLTNLSGSASPALRSGEVHTVPYFPSASDPLGRQGLVRIVNDTATDTAVRVQPYDGTGRYYEPLTLIVGAGEAAHLNSRDLEIGNASGGLSGRTGSGTGDWRLDIAGPPGVEVLAYVRAPTGSLMPVHDVADAAELKTGQGIGGALMPSASRSSRNVSPGWMGSRMSSLGLDVQ